MREDAVPIWTACHDAVPDPYLLAQTLRRDLRQHPVPQSDPRTRGLLVELQNSDEHRERLRQELPALADVFRWVCDMSLPTVVLAVNETPPTDSDSFLMMPHVDRRYRSNGFTNRSPERTTVLMLDFPPGGVGGELVVFPAAALKESPPNCRTDARTAVARAGGHLLAPQPGTAYMLPGGQPHAVLGYQASEDAPWRLVVVIAEFAVSPGERATEWCHLG